MITPLFLQLLYFMSLLIVFLLLEAILFLIFPTSTWTAPGFSYCMNSPMLMVSNSIQITENLQSHTSILDLSPETHTNMMSTWGFHLVFRNHTKGTTTAHQLMNLLLQTPPSPSDLVNGTSIHPVS